MTTYSKIVGTGSYLPAKRVTNHELAAQLAEQGIETSDEWIVTRSGISARHYAEPGQLSSDLALQAAQRALEAAGMQANDIDLIIMATSTPDHLGGFPSTACVVQRKLGITNGAPAMDVQAVCSGFVYAMSVADSFIKSGAHKNVLVIGAEVFSRILDFKDRTTCVLFGDGAGAVVMSASQEPGVLATKLHADGSHGHILCVPGSVNNGAVAGSAYLYMDGPAVFKLAVSLLDKVAREALEAAKMQSTEVDWLVPHQANIRIMQGTAKKMGLPLEKMVVTVAEHGNTSAASIPLALDQAVRDGRIRPGHTVMMEGVGGGFTWGAVLARM
ncbi:beta-ketoacyl-ACP synthase III [Herbaspirillum huttiense F1]|jgi:3-oxoacyl-[acyl-carrier-protein] synthase III (EC 2.3.1.41)|uniref:Beta-ketoacyl-[acyl-carrier-protein] synthase III n=3 Tax=Herbaspirillum huttiense TaxID=863372 RepID=A0AAJ2H7L4_9BURK|nr:MULTISPECIES: beta-ketoacyl-ACP synthase III [Herbaspirillum]MBP1312847.1 3-oxoacyl-[acyl-carrier-protein] synthase-3 [Herbaspirillum sp. 1130]MDR6738083.1 3-oxoacyl-[acyl-carrier-protein] synthase-3 [Herbaspirillum sp. 1173]MDR9834223.1 beta-ketoacyl-ACP synthase III [Herbaspirillum huttiense]MDR9847153.1 beta-ketoacyl-ACP synthase III [Herbaspirillum huttiense SE1]MDT0355563.1 beta-ketoacyl-ACP synthase III [Herbaspirillum huttiense F1]